MDLLRNRLLVEIKHYILSQNELSYFSFLCVFHKCISFIVHFINIFMKHSVTCSSLKMYSFIENHVKPIFCIYE